MSPTTIPREALLAVPLTRVEARWFSWICAAIFPEPPRGPYAVAVTTLEPGRFYARLCAEARFDHHLALRGALWIVALVAPVVVLGRLRTFGGLTVEEREAVLLGMVQSRHYLFRQLVFLMKAQAGQVYCAHPELRRRMTESRPRPRADREGLVTLRRSTPSTAASTASTATATATATATTATATTTTATSANDPTEARHARDEHAA